MLRFQDEAFKAYGVHPKRTVGVKLELVGDDSESSVERVADGWVVHVGRTSGCSPNLLDYIIGRVTN